MLQRYVLRHSKARAVYFLVSIFFSFLAAFFNVLIIYLLMILTNGLLTNKFTAPGSFFILLVMGIFIITVLKNISGYLSILSSHRLSAQMLIGMREIVFDRYLKFGKLFFDKTGSGRLNYLLTTLPIELSRHIAYLQKILGSLFMLAAYLLIMLNISWKLTIIAGVAFSFIYQLSRLLTMRLKNMSTTYVHMQLDMSDKIFNMLASIPLIKSYSSEKKEKERFDVINRNGAKSLFNAWGIVELTGPVHDTIILAALVLIASIAVFLMPGAHAIKTVNTIIFFYVAKLSMSTFSTINQSTVNIKKNEGEAAAFLKILKDEDKIFVLGGEKKFEGLKESIEFNRLNFSYIDGIRVLKNIAISIKKGKVTAIVGPTGAGKTTLINLIMRFYDCSPSTILMDGIDIRRYTLESLMSHMAMVSQDPILFNDTIRNNIIYGIEGGISEEKLTDTVKKARLYDFITQLPDKLDTVIGDRGIRLSGGEKQRVAIARALIKNSEIIILDEATSSLDTKTEQLIQEATKEALVERTAIVIAHRLSTIKDADEVIVMDNGNIIEHGSPAELLAKQGRFYDYWNTQKFYKASVPMISGI